MLTVNLPRVPLRGAMGQSLGKFKSSLRVSPLFMPIIPATMPGTSVLSSMSKEKPAHPQGSELNALAQSGWLPGLTTVRLEACSSQRVAASFDDTLVATLLLVILGTRSGAWMPS